MFREASLWAAGCCIKVMNNVSSKEKQESKVTSLQEIYNTLTRPDVTLEELDLIDQKLTEQYLGFYYAWGLEKQLQQYCQEDSNNFELKMRLLDISTGKSIDQIYSLPKECRNCLLYSRNLNRGTKTHSFEERIERNAKRSKGKNEQTCSRTYL